MRAGSSRHFSRWRVAGANGAAAIEFQVVDQHSTDREPAGGPTPIRLRQDSGSNKLVYQFTSSSAALETSSTRRDHRHGLRQPAVN